MLSILLVMFLSKAVAADQIELTTKNTVSLRTEINVDSVNKAETELQDLNTQRGISDYDLYLVIDSPGGSIDEGNNFIEFAKTIPRLKTVVLFAASMASGIVESLPGERLIQETGTMMFHRAKAQVSGQVETGELESRVMWIKSVVRAMEQKNANRIGISLPEYKQRVFNEWWIVGQDNLTQNTSDRVVKVHCSDILVKSKEKLIIDLGLFQIEGTYSSCPLLKAVQIKN